MNRSRRLALASIAASALAASLGASAAQFVVPAGGSVSLPGGSILLACANLDVQGTMTLGPAQVGPAGNVTIGAGATLAGGSGILTVGGNWTNGGTFTRGTGSVVFADGCTGSAVQLSGATAFTNLTFTSTVGRTFVLPAGSAISVEGALTLSGVPGQPIHIDSANPLVPTTIALGVGATVSSSNVLLGPNVTISAATPPDPSLPDFNADGKADLLWSNTTSGATYVWYMNGPVLITDAFIAAIDPSWKVQGVADFNSDGKPDLVWRNTANGNTYVWYMNGPNFVSDAFLFGLPPEWVIQGAADFNDDGKPDFLMRNVITGNAFVWFFNNNVAIGDQFLFNIDPSWKVEGVGDLNGDGQPDLFFRNTVGGLAFAWFSQFNAGTLSLAGSTPPLFSIDPVWEIVQVADWNNDGSPDFVFRNKNTGVVFVWYVNGTTLAGSAFIIQIDPSWEIVPRR
jgi:hypothetical protein